MRFLGWLSGGAKRHPSWSRCKARLCVSLTGINTHSESPLGRATLHTQKLVRYWWDAEGEPRLCMSLLLLSSASSADRYRTAP